MPLSPPGAGNSTMGFAPSATAAMPTPAFSATKPAPTESRSGILAAVLDPSRLPTPPAIALQVAQAASRPDCRPSEIVALLGRDPALCGKLLKAVNSCIYGLGKPVAALDRAVTILGLNTVRSLALSLSLPAMRAGSRPDHEMQEYWVSSVGGAIIARELSVRKRYPSPEDDLVAGLLGDLGAILLRQTFPDIWNDLNARWEPHQRILEPCEAEEEAFGIGHAEVSAELLRGWNLPAEIVEPIRHHHHPERLIGAAKPVAARAELLHFAGLLAHLDTVVSHKDTLDYVLLLAKEKFGMSRPDLISFLGGVVPKIVEFGKLLNQDIGQCPDFAAVLSAGSMELIEFTVNSSRSRLSGSVPTTAAIRRPGPALPPPESPEPGSRPASTPPAAKPNPVIVGGLPEFRPSFLEQFPEGGCRLGEYELRSRIGAGAMGLVFKAYEPSLARFVAIKILASGRNTSSVAQQRFAREARVAASIRHDNVVGIYAVREAMGISYLAMEFVEGGSLQDRLDAQGRFPLAEVVRLGRELASGLAAAHAKEIVHRDIKPANILLEAKTGRARITDFGLSRGLDDVKLSKEGDLIGTPHYMSPEQVHGDVVGPASDLYSLGGVLYAMLTGSPPFPDKHLAAVLKAVCMNHPTPPQRLNAEIPPWLDGAVMRLLRKTPKDRFSSAEEVAALFADRIVR